MDSRTKRTKGERVGTVPFGWRLAADGVHLVEDGEEQEILSHVYNLQANGWSLRAVAAELARRGFTSRTGRRFHRAVL